MYHVSLATTPQTTVTVEEVVAMVTANEGFSDGLSHTIYPNFTTL